MIFLDRVDSAPLEEENFSFSFYSWVAVTVDSLNETFIDLENALNNFVVQTFSEAEIVAAALAGAPDGSIWYCDRLINPGYVGKINGSLVQFSTIPFP